MLKKSITYTSPFTDEEITEEHYFHISKADLVEMEMEEHNTTYTKSGETLTGMQAKLQKIVDSEDGKAIMAEFKDIIRRSYGKKDGDRFLKSKEIWEDFLATEAYSQLLFELCTQADAAAEFMNGVVPKNIEQIAEEVRERTEGSSPAIAAVADFEDTSKQLVARRRQTVEEATPENPVVLTRVDIVEMTDEECRSGLADGRYKLS